MRLRITLVALVLMLAGAIVLAQGPRRDAGANIPLPPADVPPPPKDSIKGKPISVDVDVVNVDVVVVDKNGTLIKGLNKSDFKVFDDNIQQNITGFTSTETPLTCVIMFEFSRFSLYAAGSYQDFFNPIIGFGNALREDDWGALVK